jgi:carbamoylphosphate synthase small subunit
MSHKASRKDEQDLKEYQAVKTEQAVGKVDTKALEKELTEKGVPYSQFANSEESWRKRALKEDYAEMKLKHKWLYDQPIKADV